MSRADQFVRAVALDGPQRLTEIEVPLPRLVGRDGLIRVEACGVCGSDVANYRGTGYRGTGVAATDLLILGHEIIGRVMELGDGAAEHFGLAVGDRVALEEVIPCGRCALCLSGRYRYCRHRRYGATPLSVAPGLWGGYAEAIYLHEQAVVHRVPEHLPAELLTLFVPVANGFGWLTDLASMKPGDSVTVLGAGQHAMGTVTAAKAMAASQIIVSGLNHDADRLSLAKLLGATATVNAEKEDVVAAVWSLTQGIGSDIVVDCTPGATQSVAQALQMCAVGGRVVLSGAKRGALVQDFPSDLVQQRDLTVRGAWGRSAWAVTAALAHIEREAEDLALLTGVVFGLSEVEKAIQWVGGAGISTGNWSTHVSVMP